jgi:N12 class adenine-specific DNA methylase
MLERDHIAAFDAWANMFGEVAPGYERNAAGGYEIVERFAKFVNVPELMKRVRNFMDVLTRRSLATSSPGRRSRAAGRRTSSRRPAKSSTTYMKGSSTSAEDEPRVEAERRSSRATPTRSSTSSPTRACRQSTCASSTGLKSDPNPSSTR